MKIIYLILTFIAGFITAIWFEKRGCTCEDDKLTFKQDSGKVSTQIREPQKHDCGCGQR